MRHGIHQGQTDNKVNQIHSKELSEINLSYKCTNNKTIVQVYENDYLYRMDNKRRILNTARKLFNSQGLKKVTARVICQEMNISPGSFSYHFPDKSVIIKQLYEELLAAIGETVQNIATQGISVKTYLLSHQEIFRIQSKYKFFYLNLFEILHNHPDIRKTYLQNVKADRQMALQMLHLYQEMGIIEPDMTAPQMKRLINVGQILNNFWTLDAEIMPNKKSKERLAHYMKICCGLLEPYLTPTARQEYENYFKQLNQHSV